MRRLLSLDVVIVLGFVVLGRETHDEGNTLVDVAATAAPFLIGLLVGWLTARALQAPLDPRRGAAVALITVVVGMAVRRFVFDDGTAAAFVIVAAAFNLAGMVGWRIVATRVGRRVFEYGDEH